MKKYLIGFVLLSTISCGAFENNPNEMSNKNPKGVFIADLPKTLEFAGETVPLQFPYVQEAIEREVLVTMCQHTRTMLSLRLISRYFPVIEPILKKNGIPDDFKYLCLAESGLEVNAFSSAKAAGMWQFITSAAKTYGIETGENVDLRYHVEESTEAACRYLKAAYARFGSWTMAAASYNLGQAGVDRRANTQGVENYWDLFLPEETMRYVPRILSWKIIANDPSAYGFMLKDKDFLKPFVNYKEVKVNALSIDWSEFAASHNTNYRLLRILNPWIRSYTYDNRSGKSYTVKVPTEDFKIKGY